MDEINHAYHLLTRVYGNAEGSVAAPSMDEFSAEARAQVLKQIEFAYSELRKIHTQTQRPVHPPAPILEAHLPVDGAMLRGVRESVGISLEELASQTHIRLDYLSAMEEERFGDIPLPAVIIRGFLSIFVTEIGLDP
ncbi:MAG: helix-turn-helix domain-containing protein, partial [Holophaga sp.]|nr:helix-turn-helix domain-containing protein [Holophaga sp.]